MFRKINLIAPIIGTLLFSSITLASQQESLLYGQKANNGNISQTSNDELQKIIDSFTTYAATIPAEVREEVKKYRIEVAKVNNQKRDLYKKISQEAQSYLAKEQEYKKRMSALRKKSSAIGNNSNADGNKVMKDLVE